MVGCLLTVAPRQTRFIARQQPHTKLKNPVWHSKFIFSPLVIDLTNFAALPAPG